MLDENKQVVCNTLLKTIKATRSGSNIVGLEYAERGNLENVRVMYKNGTVKTVNVTGDSGFEMIKEILNKI